MLRLIFIYCEDPRRVGFVIPPSNPDSKPRLDYSAVRNEIASLSCKSRRTQSHVLLITFTNEIQPEGNGSACKWGRQ